MPTIQSTISERVAVISINRPERRNAFTIEMFRGFTAALTAAEDDPAVRCIVVRAEGQDFTTGLDLMDVAPAFMRGERPFTESVVDPWGIIGRQRTKPMITAVHGRCYTLGLELALASDTCVAARGTLFNLKEVRVGIVPAGGGVFRLIQTAGYSTAMRYILTGDDFDADEAHRLRVVQDVVEPGQQTERAIAIAQSIAAAPPLAIRAAIAQARTAVCDGWRAAAAMIPEQIQALITTADAREAVMALVEKRPPRFRGE